VKGLQKQLTPHFSYEFSRSRSPVGAPNPKILCFLRHDGLASMFAHAKLHRRWVGAFFFVSSAKVAKPSSDLSYDFVDLEWLQKGRFLFQLCTPCHQDRVHLRFLVITFINDLLDGHFPFLKTHRLFLLEFDFVRHA